MKALPLLAILKIITASCNFTQKNKQKKNTQPTKRRKQLELNKIKSLKSY